VGWKYKHQITLLRIEIISLNRRLIDTVLHLKSSIRRSFSNGAELSGWGVVGVPNLLDIYRTRAQSARSSLF
jgi:hypothetical protein